MAISPTAILGVIRQRLWSRWLCPRWKFSCETHELLCMWMAHERARQLARTVQCTGRPSCMLPTRALKILCFFLCVHLFQWIFICDKRNRKCVCLCVFVCVVSMGICVCDKRNRNCVCVCVCVFMFVCVCYVCVCVFCVSCLLMGQQMMRHVLRGCKYYVGNITVRFVFNLILECF